MFMNYSCFGWKCSDAIPSRDMIFQHALKGLSSCEKLKKGEGAVLQWIRIFGEKRATLLSSYYDPLSLWNTLSNLLEPFSSVYQERWEPNRPGGDRNTQWIDFGDQDFGFWGISGNRRDWQGSAIVQNSALLYTWWRGKQNSEKIWNLCLGISQTKTCGVFLGM